MGAGRAEGELVAGRWRLDRRLGEGGMGVVWAATHAVTGGRVALKFLKPEHAEHAERRRRFVREARAASLVSHPNVVAIRDVFELDDGAPLLVLDLLEGETLAARLARDGPMTLDAAASVLLPVVSAVGTAHALGVVHRDLKPDNIFLVRDGSSLGGVRVLDFGIAKLLDPTSAERGAGTTTGAGETFGTPGYMAPEQAFGEPGLDHRVDVWALGAIAYEMLSGRRPIDGDNAGQILKKLATEVIVPLDAVAPSVPEDLAHLVQRMLARDRAGRPSNLSEVAAVLRRHTGVDVPDFGPAVRLADSVTDAEPAQPAAEVSSAPPLEAGAPAPAAGRNAATPDPKSRLGLAAALAVVVAAAVAIYVVRPVAEDATPPTAATTAPATGEAAASATPTTSDVASTVPAFASETDSVSTKARAPTASSEPTLHRGALRPPPSTAATGAPSTSAGAASKVEAPAPSATAAALPATALPGIIDEPP